MLQRLKISIALGLGTAFWLSNSLCSAKSFEGSCSTALRSLWGDITTWDNQKPAPTDLTLLLHRPAGTDTVLVSRISWWRPWQRGEFHHIADSLRIWSVTVPPDMLWEVYHRGPGPAGGICAHYHPDCGWWDLWFCLGPMPTSLLPTTGKRTGRRT